MSRLEKLSCFFPAFDEQENIRQVLEEAIGALPLVADEFEVLVVDDGSSDATASIVQAMAARHPEIRLVQHPRNLGYGEALRTGFREVVGTVVFFTDADRQFRLQDMGVLLEGLADADIVIGYRAKRQDPPSRLVIARTYRLVLRALFGLRVRDVDCAFKAMRRDVLDTCLPSLRSRSAFISPELLVRAMDAGFTIEELPIRHYPRAGGRAKGATARVIARTIREILIARLTWARHRPASNT